MDEGLRTVRCDAPSCKAPAEETQYDDDEDRVGPLFAELEHVYRTAPVGLCLMDCQLRFVHINDLLADINGISAQEHIGKCLREVLPEIAEVMEPLYLQVIETGKSILNYEVCRENPQTPDPQQYYLVSYHAFKNDADQVLGVGTVVQDITDRKRAEDALRQSERNLRASQEHLNGILDTATDIVMSLDLEGTILYINHVVPGLERDDVIGTSAFDYIPRDGRDTFRHAMDQVRATRVSYHYDGEATGPHGTTAWYSCQMGPVLRDADVVGFTLVTSDITQRRKTEAALRESEQLFRTIFEQAAVGVALIDSKNGKFVRTNQKYADLIGYSDEELRQKTFVEIIHPQDLQEDLDNMEQLHQGAMREFTMEKRLVRSDGNAIWCRLTVSAIWEPGEVSEYHIAIVEDVSREKTTALALRQSEARFRAIVENSHDVINLFSAEGELIYTSPSVKRVLGYEPRELMGTVGPILVHPDDREDALRAFAEYVDKPNASGHFVHRLRHKNGTYRTVEATGINLLHEPGVNAMVSIFHDVTDRIRAEDALRQSECRYRTLVENAPDAIMVLDVERGRFVDVNEQALMLFGYSREHFLALPPQKISGPIQLNGRTFDDELARLLSRLRAGERTTFEWLHLRSNGTEFPSEVRLVALPSAEGCQIRSSVVDITQRKEQEQQLREQERALARVSRLSTMGEMVAGIAHEINQPLFSIRNFSFACTNVLRQGGDHIPSTLQYMKEIERQSDRASEIMKRLADFVRHKQPRRSTVDVNQLTNDAIELLAFEAQRWNVNVHRELRRPSRSILADVVQIQQVLVNLLRNAYEALHANTPGNRNVFVRTSFHGDDVTIDVADNGPGFVDDVAGKLFETFFSTKDQGMGMGLAIARSIIKEHGGSLRAYRREDGGATFSVNLVAESEQFNEV